MFVLVDVWKKELFTMEDYDKLEEIQESVKFHPSYRCSLLIDEYGDLMIENGCSELRYIDTSHYAFVKYIRDD
ncbi:hypothetical protein [Methanobacterium paludis]|uniref:Uncharacterized protein n=1 Tax=Methanobacterium paludis (strain DSM 25820 / JCM 18151 / SWAN1) TaxID=868131 RepID=F6D2U8_METPW|nr:hypothetical protein [Methanobacterium paludis]AEG18677.1 hypothetical protein MSWAN_1666 [Methanobacterium paludis]